MVEFILYQVCALPHSIHMNVNLHYNCIKMKFCIFFIVFIKLKFVKSSDENEIIIKNASQDEGDQIPPLLLIKKEDGFYLPSSNRKDIEPGLTEELYCTCPNYPSTSEYIRASSIFKLPPHQIGIYVCKHDYKPYHERIGECGNIQGTHLFTFSYKITSGGTNKTINGKDNNIIGSIEDFHLFVYGTCLISNDEFDEVLYEAYNIIPYSLEFEAPKPIDYDSPDYYNTLPEDVTLPYRDEFRQTLKKFKNTVDDKLIPVKMIPEFSISTNFSKKATDDPINFKPMWLSIATYWRSINHFVMEIGKKLNSVIFVGTNGILLTKSKELFILENTPDKSKLPVPLYWWILIKKVNQVKGIVIGLINSPKVRDKNVSIPIKKPCKRYECENYGWNDIIEETFRSYIFCCPVTKKFSEEILHQSIELDVLNLNKEKQNESYKIKNDIKVSSLLDELFSITELSAMQSKSRSYFYPILPRLSKSLPSSPVRDPITKKEDIPNGIFKRWLSEKNHRKPNYISDPSESTQ